MKLLTIFDRRDKLLGHQPIIYRDSVRAIILRDGKILMVYSEESNEYKFPGGGLKDFEAKEPALKREVLEEVGKRVNSVNESLGYVDQIYNDIYDNRKYFFLRTYYYFCEVDKQESEPELNLYERELHFVPRWVTLDEAIQKNQEKFDKGFEYHWTERELYVLKKLKGMMS